MATVNQLSKLGAATKAALANIIQSPLGFWNDAKAIPSAFGKEATAAAETIAHGKGPHIPGGGFIKAGGKTGLWLVDKPVALVVSLMRHGVNGVGSFYKNVPLVAVPVTAIAAVAGVTHLVTGGARARTARELQAQANAIPPQTFMNTATPAETAAMEAKMAQGGGFEAKAAASRDQAQAATQSV